MQLQGFTCGIDIIHGYSLSTTGSSPPTHKRKLTAWPQFDKSGMWCRLVASPLQFETDLRTEQLRDHNQLWLTYSIYSTASRQWISPSYPADSASSHS